VQLGLTHQRGASGVDSPGRIGGWFKGKGLSTSLSKGSLKFNRGFQQGRRRSTSSGTPALHTMHSASFSYDTVCV
jgi:hypothetical protein